MTARKRKTLTFSLLVLSVISCIFGHWMVGATFFVSWLIVS